MDELKKRVEAIEKRNRLVEANKAWEGSWFRKILIATLTYSLIAGYFYFVLKLDPWLNALVPTVGFLLSTLTLSFVKDYWIKNIYHN